MVNSPKSTRDLAGLKYCPEDAQTAKGEASIENKYIMTLTTIKTNNNKISLRYLFESIIGIILCIVFNTFRIPGANIYQFDVC